MDDNDGDDKAVLALTLMGDIMRASDGSLFDLLNETFDEGCTVTMCREATNRRRKLHRNPNQRCVAFFNSNRALFICLFLIFFSSRVFAICVMFLAAFVTTYHV